ncbi:MAG: hypothetical protein RIC55_01615, partial [Pirellulaceae bacterium]
VVSSETSPTVFAQSSFSWKHHQTFRRRLRLAVKRGRSNDRTGNGNACFNNGKPQASADRCGNVSR